MTIASKLRISSLLVLIISVAFGYSFWQTSKNLQAQRDVNDIVQAIIKNTFEFSFITNEYITNRSPRIQTQWGHSHASLETLFSQASKTLHFRDDKVSLKKIISNEIQAEEFLIRLIAKEHTNNTHNHSYSKTQTRKITQTISQIHVRIQGMLSEAARMSRRSLDRLTLAEQQLEHSSILLIFIYFLFFIVAFLLFQKKVIKPIVNLQHNAKQLALGDYDSRIPVIGDDEVSALAKDYNTLASEIQKKINTLTDKSRRLTESQKELLTLNDNLQDMVEEQTSDIRNSEYKQRTILNSMTDGVITLNYEFIIQNINPAVTQIFGYSAEDIINRKINFIISDLGEESKHTEAFCEKEGLHKSGLIFPIEITLNSMTIDDTIMYTCIVRDITERKRVEKMKDEFVSTVSHELRTPLTSIRGALSLVLSGVLDHSSEKTHELLEAAGRNTERLMHLINDILDMQKIEAGQLEYSFSQIDLMDTIEKSITDNLSYAKQYHVNIQLADKVDNIIVKVDPLRLAQIMSNLLSNAAKFSRKSSTIYIHITIENKFAKISVVDTGEGIPEEYFDKIFSKFSQYDASATKEKGGTGLGLAISKQMIEAMGGSIDFTSTFGQGTSFNIYIPIDK
ncbi:MAG: PAS domain S-box protein [Gammaproteobacteria bacterium]|nr:PAS domain S-box protein [Gammaproteobacteria bacterium]